MCGIGQRPGWSSNGGGRSGGGGGGGSGGGGGNGGGSRGSRRSRGHDATHLLNFQPLSRSPPEAPAVRPSPATRQRRPERRPGDKVESLRAKSHLLLSPSADCRGARLDPNYPIGWESVRAVRLITTQRISCPICLNDPPLAPQLYLCGHALCLPCALRYHAACDESDSLSRCPLCAELVTLDELRSALVEVVSPIKVGAGAVSFARLRLADPSPPMRPTCEAAVAGPSLLGFSQVAHRRDAAVGDGHVGPEPRFARAVDHRATADD